MTYASLPAFRTVLGLCSRSEILVEGEGAEEHALLVARWACGCTACGVKAASMMHLPCSRHDRMWTSVVLSGASGII